MPYELLTLRATGKRISDALVGDPAQGEDESWRFIREFLDDFYAADAEQREKLIRERPDFTGDPRFDAYLGALAEHLAWHYELTIPGWAQEAERNLDRWWFPTRFKSLHATALVQSPASFRRRGIFVDDTELLRC